MVDNAHPAGGQDLLGHPEPPAPPAQNHHEQVQLRQNVDRPLYTTTKGATLKLDIFWRMFYPAESV